MKTTLEYIKSYTKMTVFELGFHRFRQFKKWTPRTQDIKENVHVPF